VASTRPPRSTLHRQCLPSTPSLCRLARAHTPGRIRNQPSAVLVCWPGGSSLTRSPSGACYSRRRWNGRQSRPRSPDPPCDRRSCMPHREPLRVDHATGEAVLRQALEGKTARPHPHSALIALCLHDDDRAFVEGWCIRLGRAAPDPGMRMVAALGISYLACRFRTVGPEAGSACPDARGRLGARGGPVTRGRGRASTPRTVYL
jgi:hypothetical protein